MLFFIRKKFPNPCAKFTLATGGEMLESLDGEAVGLQVWSSGFSRWGAGISGPDENSPDFDVRLRLAA